MKNFIFGSVATFLSASGIGADQVDPSQFGSIEELIKYLISIVGGIITTIILRFLEKKFPEWFRNARKTTK